MKRYIFKAISVILCVMLIIPSVGMEFFAASITESITDMRYANLDDIEVVDADTFEEFSQEASELISEQMESSDFDVEEAKENELYTCRVIVQADNVKKLSLEDYNPETIIFDEEDKLAVLQFSTEEQTEECVEDLNKNSKVNFAETDSIVSIPETVEIEEAEEFSVATVEDADTDYEYLSWGVKNMHYDLFADHLIESGKSNTEVVVAVIDTGVELDHPFLEDRLVPGYDFVGNDDKPDDGISHGTHVSGTIVDVTHGLNVKILPVKVIGDNGEGTTLNACLGVKFAVDNGADVMNLSFGAEGVVCDENDETTLDYFINNAVDSGVVVCIAAGNSTLNTEQTCPAHCEKALTVSACDSRNVIADFSNFGEAVDFCAPGTSIYSSVLAERYGSKNGTSMATPHISAVAAMVKTMNPAYTPLEVEEFMKSVSTDLGAVGKDALYGNGLVNFYNYFSHEHVKSEDSYLYISAEGLFDGQFYYPCELCGEKLSVEYKEMNYYIDEDVFANCTSLEHVVIPEGVTDIMTQAFTGCTRLKSVTIPASVTYINPYFAFVDCPSIEKFIVNSNNENYCTDEYGVLYDINKTILIKYTTGHTRKDFTVPDGVEEVSYYSFQGCKSLENIIIPDSVTEIYNGAFSGSSSICNVKFPNELKVLHEELFINNTGLVSVTLPEKLETIEEEVFSYCTNLKEIKISENNEYFSNDENGILYNKDKTKLLNYPIGKEEKEFVLSDIVTEIGENAFLSAVNLENVILNDVLTTTGKWAFSECRALKEIVLPDSLTTVGDGMFLLCTSLVSATLSSGMTEIPDSTFYVCDKLENVVIPNSITTFGHSAFAGCTSLTDFTIPSQVTVLEPYVFNGCSGLSGLVIPTTITSFGQGAFKGVGKVEFATTRTIPGKALYMCTGVKEVVLPASTYTISKQAFYGCSDLETITIPSRLKAISTEAFYGCQSLKKLSLPASVTTIRSGAFANCTGLLEINIPDGVTIFETGTFTNCKSLVSIELPEGVTEIPDSTFEGCTSLKSVVLSKNISKISNSAFLDCTSFSEFIVEEGNSVYSSDESGVLFNVDKTELIRYPMGNPRTSYIMPDSVITLSDYSFSDSELDNIEFSKNLISIGNYAFTNSKIKSLILPEGLTTIKDYVFAYSSLTEITIPNSIENFGVYTFNQCNTIDRVYVSDLETWMSFDFKDMTSTPLYSGAVLYIDNEPLTELVIPENITSIKPYAFSSCESLSKVTIPDTVTSIGSFAFYDCNGIKDIVIPESVTYLGSAFLSCGNLESVVLPSNITRISNALFSDCEKLKNINLPEEVDIGSSAFSGCVSLEKIDLKKASIGESAFHGCHNLKEVSVDNFTSIDKYAFYACKGLEHIVISGSLNKIDLNAFGLCTSLESVAISDTVKEISITAFDYCTNLKDVYYFGDEVEWKNIFIKGNTHLKEATIHYNQKCNFVGHTGGEFVEEEYEGEHKNVQRCVDCNEIVTVKEIVLADYTLVNEAIERAKAIDPTPYSNYGVVQSAIDEVNFYLDVKNQETVDAYVAAIDEAVAGLVKIVDELNATNDASITQEGDTVYIESLVNVNYMAMYNTGKVTGTPIVLDMLGGVFKPVSSNTRYKLERTNVEFGPEENGKSQGSVATTMVIDGRTYNIVFTFNVFTLRAENIRTTSVYETFVDNDAKTITLNTKSDAKEIIFWSETAGFKFEIDKNKYEEVTRPTAYRYYISKPADKQSVVEVLVNGEAYTMTINFVESPFAPNKYMTVSNGGIELGNVVINDELVEAIIVTKKPDVGYVGLRTAGLQGATLDIAYEGIEGLTLAVTSKGSEYIKAKSATEEDIITSVTITFADGSTATYPLVFRFKDTSVGLSAIQTVNIENAKSVYDKENKTMTFYSSSDNYMRFRNWLTNGLTLTIDTSKYSFITEPSGFYEVKCPFSKVATFEMSFNDPDNTVVTATVYFFGYENEPIATHMISALRGLVAVEDGEIIFRISSGKSAITINEKLTNGETLAIDADAYDFITYADGAYTIKKAGVGQTINFTVSGVEYTATITQA